jgi:hypothetical protein
MSEVKPCECGCGLPAPIAKKTCRKYGWVKGQPVRFIHGHRAKKHSKYGSPEYHAYHGAKQRCMNPRDPAWKDYGARGIKFLFTSFEQWFAEIGPRPGPEYEHDRIENDGNYEPGNVRWVTHAEQMKNRRSWKKAA